MLGDVLVLMTGYNDAGTIFGAGVDAVMAEAARQGVPKVIWLTMRTADVSYVSPVYRSSASTFRDNNRILLQKAQQYGGALQVADWATYSANHPSWVGPDGVHLSVRGAPIAATFIADEARKVLDGLTITPPTGYVGYGPAVTSMGPGQATAVVVGGDDGLYLNHFNGSCVERLRPDRRAGHEHPGRGVAESRCLRRVRPRRRLRVVDQTLGRLVVGAVGLAGGTPPLRTDGDLALAGHARRVRGRRRPRAVDEELRRVELERLDEPRRVRHRHAVGRVGAGRNDDHRRPWRRQRGVGSLVERRLGRLVDARRVPDGRAEPVLQGRREASTCSRVAATTRCGRSGSTVVDGANGSTSEASSTALPPRSAYQPGAVAAFVTGGDAALWATADTGGGFQPWISLGGFLR